MPRPFRSLDALAQCPRALLDRTAARSARHRRFRHVVSLRIRGVGRSGFGRPRYLRGQGLRGDGAGLLRNGVSAREQGPSDDVEVNQLSFFSFLRLCSNFVIFVFSFFLASRGMKTTFEVKRHMILLFSSASFSLSYPFSLLSSFIDVVSTSFSISRPSPPPHLELRFPSSHDLTRPRFLAFPSPSFSASAPKKTVTQSDVPPPLL